jgi:hypothetical protein
MLGPAKKGSIAFCRRVASHVHKGGIILSPETQCLLREQHRTRVDRREARETRRRQREETNTKSDTQGAQES